ncbi:hypothetical protein GIB67_032002 [Kingdonia uniflora]|uniref:Protein FAR1-RELATED SEQUENCE n=1 Tax=Kingdonia uniflora TaxID=39325 RepID=A0A7J7MWB7_9MAGN|nr:hypothetical protein GIB67_032002 [Kingdonia uniflora]
MSPKIYIVGVSVSCTPYCHKQCVIDNILQGIFSSCLLSYEIIYLQIFPNTIHRLCLRHITHKFPELIGYVYRVSSSFKQEIYSLIRDTYDPEDFDARWMELMKKNKLDDNHWMQGIFNIRERWIPLWSRLTFFADMSTTGRSESTNNFFNCWLLPTIGLYSFVTKYATTLLETYEWEREEDFASEHKYCQVAPHQALLKDVAKIYTRTMFHKLEEQFDQVVHFVALEISVEGNLPVLTVKLHSGHLESFEKHINLEKLTGHYGCKLFEYVGIPCRHLLKFFSKYDILKISEAFTMARWRIGIKKFYWSYDESHLSVENLRQPLRHIHLSLRVSLLFDMASNTKENKFEFTILKLDEIESYLDHYDESVTVLEPSKPATTSPFVESMMLATSILDPLVV